MKVKKLKDFFNSLDSSYDDVDVKITNYDDFCDLRCSDTVSAFLIAKNTEKNEEIVVIVVNE